MGGGKKGGAEIEVTLYYMSQHFGVCMGPVDALRAIIIKEKEAWSGYLGTQDDIRINKPDLFGGLKKEGGVSGRVTYLPGEDDQLLPDNLAQKLGRPDGANCPGFRSITSLFFHGGGGGVFGSGELAQAIWQALFSFGGSIGGGPGFYWSANVPYLPGVWVAVQRAPVGLTVAYATIPRLGTELFPLGETSSTLSANGTFLIAPDGKTAVYYSSFGSVRWIDVETLQVVGSSPGPGVFTGTVDDADLDSAGNLYFMGAASASDIRFITVPPGGTPLSVESDAASIAFETTRAFETTGEVVVYHAYASHTGYLLGFTHVTDTESARDHYEDADGHIWQLLQPTGSSSSFTLKDLTDGTIEYTLTSPGSRSGPNHARGCATPYGHHFIYIDDNFVLVDPTDGSILDSGAAPWGDPPNLPRHDPLATYFWDGFTKYSLEDGSVLRTVDPNDWTGVSSDARRIYDPTNNAIWSRQSNNGNWIVRLLDRGDFDANPAHIIYECLTNAVWGMGSPSTLIDVTSFEDAGVTLYDEGLGLSMIWTRQAAIQDFVQEVLDHIQAVLFVDPSTGLLTLKLIRADYVAATLPVLTPSNADLSNFGRKLWGEIINEINVTWTNPTNEQDETVTIHDLASIATQGGVVSDSRNYYGVRSAELAQRLAQRDLRASGAPLASCEAVVDRTQWQLRPASCVKLDWPEYGLSGTIMRVTEVDYGKPGDPAIRLSLVEDVFGTDVGTYTPPPSSVWEDPSADPEALEVAQVLTLPYYVEAQAGFAASATYPDVQAGVLGSTSNADAWNFEVWAEVALSDGTTELQSLTTNTIAGYALLADALPAEAESVGVTLTDARGQDFPVQGGFALIGSGDDEDMELALVTLISSAGYTLSRGVLDTVPRPWPGATPIWFMSTDSSFIDPTVRSAGETATYRLRMRTSQGLLPLAGASEVTFTLSERPWLPSRPANITIGGVQFNTVDTPVDMIGELVVPVTWANRNRLTEDGQVLGWTEGDVTPETDQTTTITVYSADETTVLDTITGLTGTSHDIPIASFAGIALARVVLTSSRTDDDGTFESLQGHGIWVQVEEGSGARVTEDDDLRVTEAGEPRLTEG